MLIMQDLTHLMETNLFCSDGGVSQSQDDSIVGTRQCRHSLAIMPIPGTLSSSSPDLLQPTTSILDFSNPSGKQEHEFGNYKAVGFGGKITPSASFKHTECSYLFVLWP